MVSQEALSVSEAQLTKKFQSKLVKNNDLNRTLVSFQANKKNPGYRWFKYKEGFSAKLIEYILARVGVESGRLLDPFAGAGTTLFVARKLGLDSVGIELLPIGCEVINARLKALGPEGKRLQKLLTSWLNDKPWKTAKLNGPLPVLRITDGAYPAETEKSLRKYLAAIESVKDKEQRRVLRFVALCVLEEISFTRKDGQYLRWDTRCGLRTRVKPFDKGRIVEFDEAIELKLTQILSDMSGGETPDLFGGFDQQGNVQVIQGSCLDELPKLESSSFDCIITSPPYCNRYDYTRTYALELALLETTEDQLRALRQTMVSCTVENRTKEGLESVFSKKNFKAARKAFESQSQLQGTLEYLEQQKAEKLLNNPGIPRMVREYFWEMSLVIFECARVLKPGAPLVMVNDNVRYQGAGIPVDLILSEIAQAAGMTVEKIWVLPTGKGNSSQQMGKHGRDELRKCVYIWRRATKKATKKSNPELAAQP